MTAWQCFACGLTGPSGDHVCGVPNNPDGNEFFVDCRRYTDPRPTISVSEIKRIMGRSGSAYTLYLERADDAPDVPLFDSQAVDIRTTPHMYLVPPATFG